MMLTPSSWQKPNVQSQSMLVGASHVPCCVVNVYGMQHLSWLSFTVKKTSRIITHWVYPLLN